jgi:hypothetical protein
MLGFFRSRKTRANFMASGNTPDDRERFTILVIGATRTPTRFFKR